MPITPKTGSLFHAGSHHGHQDQLNAHVVNYADDFVICCRPGNAVGAKTRMTALMTRLGLEVNETKTRLARIPEDNITFLGYTLGRHCQLSGARAPFCGPARLDRGITIGEQRTF
jgi:hypothetical protein